MISDLFWWFNEQIKYQREKGYIVYLRHILQKKNETAGVILSTQQPRSGEVFRKQYFWASMSRYFCDSNPS